MTAVLTVIVGGAALWVLAYMADRRRGSSMTSRVGYATFMAVGMTAITVAGSGASASAFVSAALALALVEVVCAALPEVRATFSKRRSDR